MLTPTNSGWISSAPRHFPVPASSVFVFPTFQGLLLSTRVELFSSHLQNEEKQKKLSMIFKCIYFVY